jgi:hypothetical protein
MCPLVDVLRAEVTGIQAAILKDLQEARDMVVERKAEMDLEERLEDPFHALCPACGDRPDIGALDAHRDPRAGDLEGLGGAGAVAMARAWIASEAGFRGRPALSVAVCGLPRGPDEHHAHEF